MYSNANTWHLPALNVSNLTRPSETMNGHNEPCHEHITMTVYPALVPSNSHIARSGSAPAVASHSKSPVRMAVLACLACPVRTGVCLLAGADAAFRTTEIQSCWPQSCLMAHSSLFNCSDGLRSSQRRNRELSLRHSSRGPMPGGPSHEDDDDYLRKILQSSDSSRLFLRHNHI